MTGVQTCALPILEMVASGALPGQGFIKQEEIPFDKFMATKNGAIYRNAEQVAGGATFVA